MEKRKDEVLDGMRSINFEWVRDATIPGMSSSQTRRQVRSHITRLQHRRARAGLQYRDKKPYSTIKPPKKASGGSASPPEKKTVVCSTSRAVRKAKSNASATNASQAEPRQEADELIKPSMDAMFGCYQISPGSSDSSISSSTRSKDGDSPLQPLSDYFSAASSRADPFNTYPVKYHAIHDKLLHHMLTVFAPQGWPVMNISRAQGLSWERFMTQEALVEPALFLVRLLFATGDLIRLNQLDPRVADWLRSQAVNEINAALSNPSRYISDGLILAVGRIALGELLYGDREAAIAIHRPAWKKMIEMRGGMKRLPFPALVKKLMRWSDSVMALKSNTRRLLEEPEEGEQTFTSAQSTGVLKQWAPLEEKPTTRRT